MKQKKIKIADDPMFKIFILHLVFQYLRPQDMIVFLSILRLPFIFQAIMIIYAIQKGLPLISKNKTAFWILLFCGLNLGTLLFVVNHNAWYNASLNLLSYLFSMVIPALLLINTKARLISLLKAWIIIHVLLSLWVITHAGRGPGSFLSDENDVAMVLAMAIPYPLLLLREKLLIGKWRLIASVAIPILITGVITTNSRGSFLGLAAVVIGYLYFYRRSIRAMVSVLILCLIGFLLAPQTFIDEILSINDAENSTRNDRLDSWKAGMFMFTKNPVLGVGTGNYPWRISDYELLMGNDGSISRMHGGRAAHSLYVTLLTELGVIGALFYMRIIYIFLKENINNIKIPIAENTTATIDSNKDKSNLINSISRANMISLFSFSISAIFISVFYYPPVWLLFGLSASTHNVSKQNKLTL